MVHLPDVIAHVVRRISEPDLDRWRGTRPIVGKGEGEWKVEASGILHQLVMPLPCESPDLLQTELLEARVEGTGEDVRRPPERRLQHPMIGPDLFRLPEQIPADDGRLRAQ